MVAGGFEVFGELRGGQGGVAESFGADGPYSGDPGKFGAGAPFVGEVEPFTSAEGGFDLLTGFQCEEGGVADEDGGVCALQHGDRIGRGGDEGGVGVEEFAEENLGVGEGTAGGCVGCNGFNCGEGMRGFDDELDGSDFVERGDGAAGNNGELRREGCDGDEAEVGASSEEFVCAARRKCVMEGVALG